MSIFNMLFFPVSLILSLPNINPSFTVLRVKISNVIASLQGPASPNPRLSLRLISRPCFSTTTWPCHMGLFFFFLAPQTCTYLVSRDSALTQSVHCAVLDSSFMSWGLSASLSSCFHAYFIVPGLWLCPTSLP